MHLAAARGEEQIADVAHHFRVHTRLFAHFAMGGLFRSFVALDVTLGQDPVVRKAAGADEEKGGTGGAIPAHDATGMSQAGHTPILRVLRFLVGQGFGDSDAEVPQEIAHLAKDSHADEAPTTNRPT